MLLTYDVVKSKHHTKHRTCNIHRFCIWSDYQRVEYYELLKPNESLRTYITDYS